MTLPRAAQFDSSAYSARRIVFIWTALCIAGWTLIFWLIKTLVLAAEYLLA